MGLGIEPYPRVAMYFSSRRIEDHVPVRSQPFTNYRGIKVKKALFKRIWCVMIGIFENSPIHIKNYHLK